MVLYAYFHSGIFDFRHYYHPLSDRLIFFRIRLITDLSKLKWVHKYVGIFFTHFVDILIP